MAVETGATVVGAGHDLFSDIKAIYGDDDTVMDAVEASFARMSPPSITPSKVMQLAIMEDDCIPLIKAQTRNKAKLGKLKQDIAELKAKTNKLLAEDGLDIIQ